MTRNGRHNGHRGDGHKTETPDVSHIRNEEVTHERSDVSVRGVVMFCVVLGISIAIVSFGVWIMFRYFNAQEAKAPQPGPMALSKDERLPPEPRLQAAPGFAATLENNQRVNLERGAPQAEYKVLREQWEKELHGELKDQSGNPLSMPIDQAMKQIATGGALPARAQTAPGKLQDYAISLPTAESSGRETMKRVQ
jgi:hypothetical protein